MSSPPSWQDRRFMFPAGKEVHQGSARRMSGASASTADSPVLANATAAAPAATTALPDHPTTDRKVLSNPDAWGGNRLFMGRAAKEVHQPARRPSASSATKPEVPKSSSPPATSPTSPGGGVAAAIAGRRRSSASGGVFSGLMGNRTGHEDRLQDRHEQKNPPGSFGGLIASFTGTKAAEKK